MYQLWKHPNGNYYALHGHRLRSRASLRTKDRQEADRLFNQFVAEHSGLAPEAPTVGKIIDGYKTSRSGKIRAPNALKYAAQSLVREMGDLLPGHLHPATIEKYAAARQTQGCGAGTILREVGVLRAALAWGVQNNWLKPYQAPKVSNPVKIPKGRERWLSRDDAERLLKACRMPHLRLFVMLGLMTGARSEAILELRWGQVDLKRKEPLIDMGEGHGNKRRAIVPVNADLRRELERAQEIACSDHVVELHGKSLKTLKNGFEAACVRAKVEGVTPHILRHTCATWQVEKGVSYAKIGKMLGMSAQMVENRYGHHSPDYLKEGAAALQLTGRRR